MRQEPEPVTLPWPIDVFVRRPVVGGVFGAIVAVGSGVGFFHSLSAYRAAPTAPEPMATLDAAAVVEARGSAHVELTDASWECDTPLGRNDQVLVMAPAGEALVVAIFDGAVRCDVVATTNPTGELRPLPAEGIAAMAADGFDVEDRPVLKLCTYCGAGNDLLGVVLSAVLGLLGLLAYPMCRYLNGFVGSRTP